MQKRRLWHYLQFILSAVVLVAVGGASTVFATTSSSTSYQVTETEFGASSTAQNCSTQYCAQASIGGMAAGSSASNGYKATFGAITSSDPLLEVIVNSGQSDFGTLSTQSTAAKTMTVQVRNYLSGGYTLQIVGNPPKYGSHALATPSTPTAATPGTEQFAINASANTTPSVGAAPVQVPSTQTSFGIVNDNYHTPNLFKYTSGDVVAHSNSESGQTNYTISMIVNISNATPAGHYSGDYAAIVVPVY
jgi:hypothetical protein